MWVPLSCLKRRHCPHQEQGAHCRDGRNSCPMRLAELSGPLQSFIIPSAERPRSTCQVRTRTGCSIQWGHSSMALNLNIQTRNCVVKPLRKFSGPRSHSQWWRVSLIIWFGKNSKPSRLPSAHVNLSTTHTTFYKFNQREKSVSMKVSGSCMCYNNYSTSWKSIWSPVFSWVA